MDDDRLPIIGYKSLRLEDRGGDDLVLRSPSRNTVWSEQGLTAERPSPEDAVGIYATYDVEGTRIYGRYPVVAPPTITLDSASGQLRVVSASCSVVAAVAGSPDDNLLYPEGWRSPSARVVVLGRSDGISGLPPSKWAQNGEELAVSIDNRTVTGNEARQLLQKVDFGPEFSRSAVERLGGAWRIPVVADADVETLGAEYGQTVSYVDKILPMLTNGVASLSEMDEDWRESIGLALPDLFVRDPLLATELIGALATDSSPTVRMTLAFGLPRLRQVDSAAGLRYGMLLAGDTELNVRDALARSAASLLDKDPTLATTLLRKVLASDLSSYGHYHVCHALADLYRIAPDLARAVVDLPRSSKYHDHNLVDALPIVLTHEPALGRAIVHDFAASSDDHVLWKLANILPGMARADASLAQSIGLRILATDTAAADRAGELLPGIHEAAPHVAATLTLALARDASALKRRGLIDALPYLAKTDTALAHQAWNTLLKEHPKSAKAMVRKLSLFYCELPDLANQLITRMGASPDEWERQALAAQTAAIYAFDPVRAQSVIRTAVSDDAAAVHGALAQTLPAISEHDPVVACDAALTLVARHIPERHLVRALTALWSHDPLRMSDGLRNIAVGDTAAWYGLPEQLLEIHQLDPALACELFSEMARSTVTSVRRGCAGKFAELYAKEPIRLLDDVIFMAGSEREVRLDLSSQIFCLGLREHKQEAWTLLQKLATQNNPLCREVAASALHWYADSEMGRKLVRMLATDTAPGVRRRMPECVIKAFSADPDTLTQLLNALAADVDAQVAESAQRCLTKLDDGPTGPSL